jgi:hypothetical protein
MELVVQTDGTISCLYDEALDLTALGNCEVQRASFVEPHVHGGWTADLWPVSGPVLGPFALRSEALAAERKWLDHYLLSQARSVMFFVVCPGCGSAVEIPETAVGPERTDLWNVCRCDVCNLSFDYDDQELQFEIDEPR